MYSVIFKSGEFLTQKKKKKESREYHARYAQRRRSTRRCDPRGKFYCTGRDRLCFMTMKFLCLIHAALKWLLTKQQQWSNCMFGLRVFRPRLGAKRVAVFFFLAFGRKCWFFQPWTVYLYIIYGSININFYQFFIKNQFYGPLYIFKNYFITYPKFVCFPPFQTSEHL